MEAIITVVGFLGAGKTTLLKHLMKGYLCKGWKPYIILNDYENAYLDMHQFLEEMEPQSIVPLHGSCICCSGINELRDYVNRIPERNNGVTLIEANGTSDSSALMGFLGVGLSKRYLPPIQVSVVDVKNWQGRGEHNELEANQIQLSSLIVLTHLEDTSNERRKCVAEDIQRFNPSAKIICMDEVDSSLLPRLSPSANQAQPFDHLKAHWASASIDLPMLPDIECMYDICSRIPKSILRVKGCAQVGDDEQYTYFERTPDGEVHIKLFYGVPTTGPKLLSIGLGSEASILQNVVQSSLEVAETRIDRATLK